MKVSAKNITSAVAKNTYKDTVSMLYVSGESGKGVIVCILSLVCAVGEVGALDSIRRRAGSAQR